MKYEWIVEIDDDEDFHLEEAKWKQELVRCKDCKHRPSGSGANHDVEFPDEICPCQCEDYWYSWIPKDNFFCAWGEKKRR